MGAHGSGGRPTPTAILEMRGSWRAKTRSGEPTPQKGKPPCPKGLTAAQRAVWRRLCTMLHGMNVLTVVDGAQLERYCVYLCQWREAVAWLNTNGTTYPVKSAKATEYMGKLPGGEFVVRLAEYPQVWQSHRLDKALKEIEFQFGLTPAARARLRNPEENDVGGDDRKARFFQPAV